MPKFALYSKILTQIFLAHLLVLAITVPGINPFKFIKKPAKKMILRITRNNPIASIGKIDGSIKTQYLRHSDDKRAKVLKKYSYQKIIKKLNKADQTETDPLAKKFSLTNFKLPFDKDAELKMNRELKYSLSGKQMERFIKANRRTRTLYQNVVPTLHNSKVSVIMDIPKGMQVKSLEQLNNIFYSYQRRLNEAYINSFYSYLIDFENSHPHLNFPMTEKELTLGAKLTFDQQGNLQKIKMTSWSENKDLQEFFAKVLGKLQSIPNPPKAYSQNKEHFNVNFKLFLNQRNI
jgi:hypothetical protein